jgi:outer membrane lipoprotein-sorting protein
MNCLSAEQLVTLALALDARRGGTAVVEHDHVRDCPACADALARVGESLSRVEAAHAPFARGHEEARARLLAALDGEGAGPRARPRRMHSRVLKEVVTVRRMLIGGPVAAAALGLLVVWASTRPPSALAQTTKALQEVKSYQCRITFVGHGADEDKQEKEVEILRWAAPGSLRTESITGGKPVNVRILVRGKPGLEIDHKYETFQRLEPLYEPMSPLLLLADLAKFTGAADRELPERTVQGQAARGFEIAVAKIDPDSGDGALRLWPAPRTKLPLRLELDLEDLGTLVMEEFSWNVPTDGWFDTEPPAKYQDETPTPAAPEHQTEHIVKGLKAYAKYCGGKYPPVKMVYGDVTSARLFKAAGLSSPARGPTEVESAKEEYHECSGAALGFSWINTIQRHNPDAAYHGKAVGPQDKGKVLFRWRLPGGDYRVIYGDLRAETVTAARLKELEGG